MSQLNPILVYGGMLVAVLSGLLLAGWAILGRHAGSADARKQAARILAVVVLYVSVFGSVFMILSVREIRTEINIQREYQDRSVDAVPLEVAESFDYDGLMGPLEFGRETIFPPYPYMNETQIAPFIQLFPYGPSRPSHISYFANITHPGALVNVSGMLGGFFWEYATHISQWMRVNASWENVTEGTEIITTLAWLVEIDYYSDGDVSSEVRLIVGLNSSQGIILAIRGETYILAMTAVSLPLWLMIPGLLFVAAAFTIVEADRSWQVIKRIPRAVTRENLLENGTRVAVLQAIREKPGLTFSSLKRLVDRSPKTLLQQLGILQRFGLVRAREIRHNTVFFDSTVLESTDVLHYFQSSGKFNPILMILESSPGISFIDLMSRLGEPRTTLIRKVKLLEKYGLLSLSRAEGRIFSIEPRPATSTGSPC